MSKTSNVEADLLAPLRKGRALVATQVDPEKEHSEFSWCEADKAGDIAVPEQRRIAIYVNPFDAVVLRQEDDYDGDKWVSIQAPYLPTVIEQLFDNLDERDVEPLLAKLKAKKP